MEDNPAGWVKDNMFVWTFFHQDMHLVELSYGVMNMSLLVRHKYAILYLIFTTEALNYTHLYQLAKN